MKIGISACLLGRNCTYKGTNNLIKEIEKLDGFDFVEICPEVMGGLSTPRPPAEIMSSNPISVINKEHIDVTNEYIKGAQIALNLLKKNHVKVVLLKHHSPSCGNEGIYNGSFSHTVIDGRGVCADLLEKNGINTFNEEQIEMFLKYIKKEGI